MQVDQVQLHLVPYSSAADAAASMLQSSEFRPVEHFLQTQELLSEVDTESDRSPEEAGAEVALDTTTEEGQSSQSQGEAEVDGGERRFVLLLDAHHAVLLMATFCSLRQYQLQPGASYCAHSSVAEHFNPDSFLSTHSNFS